MKEMEVLKHLRHPNIVEYIGMEHKGDFTNVFLEYVFGDALYPGRSAVRSRVAGRWRGGVAFQVRARRLDPLAAPQVWRVQRGGPPPTNRHGHEAPSPAETASACMGVRLLS